MLDPLEKSILIVLPGQKVQVLTGDATLPMLSGIDLSLTAAAVFRWLTL
jgi:hypothetical protein